MLVPRSKSACAMFEGDDEIWWVTGGWSLDSTEVFNVTSNAFKESVDLPEDRYDHNLVNVNQTHMVLLGDGFSSAEVYIINR